MEGMRHPEKEKRPRNPPSQLTTVIDGKKVIVLNPLLQDAYEEVLMVALGYKRKTAIEDMSWFSAKLRIIATSIYYTKYGNRLI